jgi:hypothetical protein
MVKPKYMTGLSRTNKGDLQRKVWELSYRGEVVTDIAMKRDVMGVIRECYMTEVLERKRVNNDFIREVCGRIVFKPKGKKRDLSTSN